MLVYSEWVLTHCCSQIINFLPNNGTGNAPYVNCTVLVSVDHSSQWTSNTDITDKPNAKCVSVYRKVTIMFLTIHTTLLMQRLTSRTSHTTAIWPRYSTFYLHRDTGISKHHVSMNLCYILFQPTYVNPLVGVKFHLINQRHAVIQCRVTANNIAYQNFYDPYEGKVTFHLNALS